MLSLINFFLFEFELKNTMGRINFYFLVFHFLWIVFQNIFKKPIHQLEFIINSDIDE